MPRPIVIQPETLADIRYLCGVYRLSACYCRKGRQLCLACRSKRVLAAIGDTPIGVQTNETDAGKS
jgi:hypothetical protein